MLPMVKRWGTAIALSFAALTILLAAEPAHVPARMHARQSNRCPYRDGQTQPDSRQQLTMLRYALQKQLRQLNALQQTGQLTPAQLQVASQLASTIQYALQLAASQNSTLTLAQLQRLGEQQLAIALQLRALQALRSP